MSKWVETLRRMAAIAQSSELHDIKCGLEPDEAIEISDELERLSEAIEAAKKYRRAMLQGTRPERDRAWFDFSAALDRFGGLEARQ